MLLSQITRGGTNMTFGPEGFKEVTDFTEEEYYDALRAIEAYEDSEMRSTVIDHARAIMSGRVPDGVLINHLYETLALLKDVSISRISYILEKFGEFETTKDRSKLVIDILSLQGKSAVEARRMETIIKRMINLPVGDDILFIKELWMSKNAVHAYALTNEMVKDLIKCGRG